MNDFINAHPLERKERIAFDLMLKIAECDSHCKQTTKPESKTDSEKSESQSTGNACSETKGKNYWLELYADCLAVVQQKKVKK